MLYAHGADVGIRGEGATLAEAFAAAAVALTAAVCEPAVVTPRERVGIHCEAADVEELFYEWINALVFEMTTRQMLFARFDVRIEGTRLDADAWGERIDVARHQPAAEVKGATYTDLRVCPSGAGRWIAQCVVDV